MRGKPVPNTGKATFVNVQVDSNGRVRSVSNRGCVAISFVVALCALIACGGSQTAVGPRFPGPKGQLEALAALRQDLPDQIFVIGTGVVAIDGEKTTHVLAGVPGRYPSHLMITASSPYPHVVRYLKKEGFLDKDNSVGIEVYLLDPGVHTFTLTYQEHDFEPGEGFVEYRSVSDQSITATLEAGKSYRVAGVRNRMQLSAQDTPRWLIGFHEVDESEWAPDMPLQCPEGMTALPGGALQLDDAIGGTVRFRPYCLDTTLVTVAAYTTCVNAGKCSAEDLTSEHSSCNYGQPEKGQHPINCVDWTQANAYCRAQGKRLPSAAEWIWASSGGEAMRPYPWGDREPDDTLLCWSGTTEREGTCPVGSFPAGDGRWGTKDLVGDVGEWTDTAWASKAPDNEATHRFCAAMSWKSTRYFLPLMGSGIGNHGDTTGFRCAR